MKDKLYILEKIWNYSSDMNFDQSTLHEVLIRPCNVSYRTYRNFALGNLVAGKHFEYIIHEPCIMDWMPNSKYHALDVLPDLTECKSFEEFMIYANLNKCIFPLIENWYVRSSLNYDTYVVKKIDLKTNEVLFDGIKPVFKKLSEQCN